MSDVKMQLFTRLSSCVEPSFWHKLSQIKLEIDKLNENQRIIWGRFEDGNITLDVSSFNSEAPSGYVQGTLLNLNTLETFRDCDKDASIKEHGKKLEQLLINGDLLKNPSLALGNFMLLTFADLKKYHFYYWFAFPVSNTVKVIELSPPTNDLSEEEMKNVLKLINKDTPIGFTVRKINNEYEILPLSEYTSNDLIGFHDNSNNEQPLWPLRTLLWIIAHTWPTIGKVNVLCIGRKVKCRVLHLTLELNNDKNQWLGWEPNERGKLGPRRSDLAATMDPLRLSETAVDLNLRLMKWRLMPDLNLDILSNTRCLLLGAGTLGCGVARGLLAWGVRNITLLDYGRVQYSNPVRQSLFNHKHCLNGGIPKAVAAAESLKEIFPGAITTGVQLSIPMPGHSVPEAQQSEVLNDCKKLEELIKAHDVIYLLMDTRESRWLPTLLAKLHDKIVINAALGFDSFLVMRHGSDKIIPTASSSSSESSTNIPGTQLGCYFCNDVVAPRNSTAARTLDQQCTVVRPGGAQMAAAIAVELMVSVLQHPLQACAPATCETGDKDCCTLGVIPHSIRGFLASFQLVTPASHAFSKCAACSQIVINEYKEKGFEFLLQVFNSPTYLEEVTGLAELQKQSLSADIWTISDSDEEEDD